MTVHPWVAMAQGMAAAALAREQSASDLEVFPLPPASPSQYIGIWESEDGTVQESTERHPARAARYSAAREAVGPRAFTAIHEENDGPGRAQDIIIQRWVSAHGLTEYIYAWKEKLDGQARSR